MESIRESVLAFEENESDIFLCRCIGHSQNLAAARLLERTGARVVNSSSVMEICGDKVATSSVLEKAGIPQPRFAVALSQEGAIKAAEQIGYPVVFKPAVGSWGRLLARVADRETAESVAEHKEHLGPNHQIFYIQEYVQKPGYDIRAFVVGGNPVCAIRRNSDHWITNTARGGTAGNHLIDEELHGLLCRVHQAIPGDFLAVDCFVGDTGYLVNEVNDGAEFRNSIAPTGQDIALDVINLCGGLLKRKHLKRVGCKNPAKERVSTGSGIFQ